jgi:gamma-glutamyltranspeptidase
MAKAANEVPPGTPASAAAEATFPGGFPKTASAQSLDRTSADTMYLTVADDEGTMVSLIQSNFQGFGSGLVAGGFGLQDRGSLFNMAEGSANQCVIARDCMGLNRSKWDCMQWVVIARDCS